MFSCQKHFSKNKLVQNDKKINNITDTKKSKRASSSASDLSGNEDNDIGGDFDRTNFFDRTYYAGKCR